MVDAFALHPVASAILAPAILLAGAYVAAATSAVVEALVAREAPGPVLLRPLQDAALLLRQEANVTERPDALLWALAPATYAALAAGALAVVPLADHVAIADVRTGIVAFGAAEALAMVAVFLHGWAPNSHLPLIGAYRFVALALSYELLSMFVLIAAALPAESLRVSSIVEAQAELWNVVRQPLGLPLWLVVMLGVTFLGPANVSDGADLGSGTSAEVSGPQRLAWETARGGMLAVFSLMGASVFLGGWHGPLLPGWLWIALKAGVVMTLALLIRHHVGRLPAERAVRLLWTIGLPLAFLGLLQAGLVALR